MGRWPFRDDVGETLPLEADLRAEDVFLLWLIRLPLDADPARAACALLAEAPPLHRDQPFQRRLRALLQDTVRAACAT